MALSDDHLNLLVLACETTVARDFECRVDAKTPLAAAGHEGLVCGAIAAFFNPRVLAIRLGHSERTGLGLTRELTRYDYVRTYGGNTLWQVTADGARVAADFKKSSLPRPRTAGRDDVTAMPASPAAGRCSRCDHEFGTREGTFCARCGWRRSGSGVERVLTTRQGPVVVAITFLIIGLTVGAFIGLCLP